MSNRKQVFKGIRWNTLVTIFSTLLGILQIYLLVRYVDKKDFGLMALVNVVVIFANTFLDLGVNNAIIYKRKINQKQLSTLYWLSVFFGVFLSLVVVLISPLVASFYEEPQVSWLLKLMALVFIMNGFGSQFRVLFTKELQFDRLAIIQLSSISISFLVTVFLAIKGYGVLALIVGVLCRTFVDTLLSIYLGRKQYKPSLFFDLKEISFFLKFGVYQIGEGVFNYFKKQSDVLIIGKLLGSEILGIYDVIKKLLVKPLAIINPIITKISFPLMSKIQMDKKRLAEIYLQQINYICTLNFPIYLFLFFHSETVYLFFLGASWQGYDFVFKGICIYYLIYSTGNPIGSLILSSGRADLGFYWNFIGFLLYPATLYISTQWGLQGVVSSLIFLQLFFIFPLYLLVIRKLIPISFFQYLKTLLKPLILVLLITFIPYQLSTFLTDVKLVQIIFCFVIGAAGYLFLNFKFNRQFMEDLVTLINVRQKEV